MIERYSSTLDRTDLEREGKRWWIVRMMFDFSTNEDGSEGRAVNRWYSFCAIYGMQDAQQHTRFLFTSGSPNWRR